jgi:hypothetical protein
MPRKPSPKPDLTVLLDEALSDAALHAACKHFLGERAGARRESLRRLAEALTDSERLAAALAKEPPGVAAVLRAFVDAGGLLPTASLVDVLASASGIPRAEMGGLLSHTAASFFLLTTSQQRVTALLPGQRQAISQVLGPVLPEEAAPDPVAMTGALRDALVAVRLWQQPPRLTQQGEVYVRAAEKLDAFFEHLPSGEHWVGSCRRLRMLGIARPPRAERSPLRVDVERARDYLRRPVEEQARIAVAAAWHGAVGASLLGHLCRSEGFVSRSALCRLALLQVAAADARALLHSSWHRPESVERLRAQAGRTVDLLYDIGRLEVGRTVSGDAAYRLARERAAEPRVCHVQPNFQILVPPECAPWSVLHLAEIADLTSVATVATFALTRESIVRGVSRGRTGAEILSLLESLAVHGVPANVAHEIRRWSASVGHVQLAQGTVVGFGSAEELARARSDPAAGKWLGPGVGATGALVAEKDLDRLLAGLRANGFAVRDEVLALFPAHGSERVESFDALLAKGREEADEPHLGTAGRARWEEEPPPPEVPFFEDGDELWEEAVCIQGPAEQLRQIIELAIDSAADVRFVLRGGQTLRQGSPLEIKQDRVEYIDAESDEPARLPFSWLEAVVVPGWLAEELAANGAIEGEPV